MVHLSRTFPGIFPYLHGIYNTTMNEWHGGSNCDGWKYTRAELNMLHEMDDVMNEEGEQVLWNDPKFNHQHLRKKSNPKAAPSGNPKHVVPVERLIGDISALRALLENETPLDWLVQGSSIHAV